MKDGTRPLSKMTALESHSRVDPCWLAYIAPCYGKQDAPISARLRPRMEAPCDPANGMRPSKLFSDDLRRPAVFCEKLTY